MSTDTDTKITSTISAVPDQQLLDQTKELAVPAERLRPLGDGSWELGAGSWELKFVIDAPCQRGLEQLKVLLSHVDPHLTLGALVGRAGPGGTGPPRPDPAPARRQRQPARLCRADFASEVGSEGAC